MNVSPAFTSWLAENGLSEVFTTPAGDSFYANTLKKFGVLRKLSENGVRSFYLDDIIDIQTFDDENQIAHWNYYNNMMVLPLSTRFSTNEVFIKITLRNQMVLKLQVFHGTRGNISRNTQEHIQMMNYACSLTRALSDLAQTR